MSRRLAVSPSSARPPVGFRVRQSDSEMSHPCTDTPESWTLTCRPPEVICVLHTVSSGGIEEGPKRTNKKRRRRLAAETRHCYRRKKCVPYVIALNDLRRAAGGLPSQTKLLIFVIIGYYTYMILLEPLLLQEIVFCVFILEELWTWPLSSALLRSDHRTNFNIGRR